MSGRRDRDGSVLHPDLESDGACRPQLTSGTVEEVVARAHTRDADRVQWHAERCETALSSAGKSTKPCDVLRGAADLIRAAGECATDPECLALADVARRDADLDDE